MGGFGSGRHGGKSCTDDMRALDVRKLQRQGQLVPGIGLRWDWTIDDQVVASINLTVGDDRVTLNYRQRNAGQDWEQMSYPVFLEWTPCHFGGRRAWWRCPASGCGRRVAVLFGGAVFACRHCHRLAYRSQREAADDRATRRAEKIRQRLGWIPGILNEPGDKPKGMWWETFDRLQSRHDASVSEAFAGVIAKVAPWS